MKLRTFKTAAWVGLMALGAVGQNLVSIVHGGARSGDPGTSMSIKRNAPTFLYGKGATTIEGNIQPQKGGHFRWTGNGRLIWNVRVKAAGKYEVSLNHSSDGTAAGRQIQVFGSLHHRKFESHLALIHPLHVGCIQA